MYRRHSNNATYAKSSESTVIFKLMPELSSRSTNLVEALMHIISPVEQATLPWTNTCEIDIQFRVLSQKGIIKQTDKKIH